MSNDALLDLLRGVVAGAMRGVQVVMVAAVIVAVVIVIGASVFGDGR